MPLIVLTGRYGVGKDSVADIIQNEVADLKIKGISVSNRISLANPLKETCCRILGIDVKTLEKLKRSNESIAISGQYLTTIRQFMINVSREIKDMSGEMIFVSKAMNRLQDQPYVLDIITDVRYPREYETFRSFEYPDTTIIKIVRKGLPEIEDEENIDRFSADYTVENNGSLEDLEIAVKGILRHHFSQIE